MSDVLDSIYWCIARFLLSLDGRYRSSTESQHQMAGVADLRELGAENVAADEHAYGCSLAGKQGFGGPSNLWFLLPH